MSEYLHTARNRFNRNQSSNFPEKQRKTNSYASQEQIRDQLHNISQNDQDLQSTMYMKFKYDNILSLQNIKKSKNKRQNIWQQQLTDWVACEKHISKNQYNSQRETNINLKKYVKTGNKGNDVIDQQNAVINQAELSHRYTFLHQHSWRNQSDIIKPEKAFKITKSPNKIQLNLSMPKKVPEIFKSSFRSETQAIKKTKQKSGERSEFSLPKYEDMRTKKNSITPYNYIRHNENLKQKILSNLKSVLDNKDENSTLRSNKKNIEWEYNNNQIAIEENKMISNKKKSMVPRKLKKMKQFQGTQQIQCISPTKQKLNKQQIKQLKNCIIFKNSTIFSSEPKLQQDIHL